MSSGSVLVLAPNGRRQTVKCSPNTTVLQIIEEVCKKQGFNPEEYDVKHHNKVLDTTVTFRFSGLPNNAQLELAPAVKVRQDSEVILAVNLENGERIVGNFQPDETLWNVLLKLCPNEIESDKNPVLIYTRNEIYGDNLQKSSLRSLGLRGGRAMMRLIHRAPEELKVQANVSATLPAKPVEEKPYHRTLKTESPLVAAPQNTVAESPKPLPFQKKPEVDILKLAREKRKLTASPAKAVESEDQLPRRAKIDVGPKMDMKLESPKEEAMEVDCSPKHVNDEPVEEINDFLFLGERNALLFSLESSANVPSDDLPDDFFELTIDDAKKILHDIRRKKNDVENATLMTSAMRQLEESKKQLRHLNKYKKSVIRVQFPDRTILQGTFTPTETIQDVVNFVREYLEDTSINVHLYTTPPKCVLLEEKRLMEVGCVPGALLHLGTESANENLLLKSGLRDKFTTNSLASLAASKMRKEGTRSIAEDQDSGVDQVESMDTVTDLNVAGPSSQPTSYERKVIKSSEKVPKWFKPSK